MRQPPPTFTWKTCLALLLISPLLVLVLAGVLIYLAGRSIYTACLHAVIYLTWRRRGIDVLFVHSDSPLWQEYIEQSILPEIRHRAVLLNWSERKRWPRSLARAVFQRYAGKQPFNPMAVVILPFRRTQTFRFYVPFLSWKRGETQPLEDLQRAFFNELAASSSVTKSPSQALKR